MAQMSLLFQHLLYTVDIPFSPFLLLSALCSFETIIYLSAPLCFFPEINGLKECDFKKRGGRRELCSWMELFVNNLSSCSGFLFFLQHSCMYFFSLLEPTMIFSFADKSYFAASSLLEQLCLSSENINAEFWWHWPQFDRKEPRIYLGRREPIGCRQQSCNVFYVCFSLNYSRIYLCLSFFIYSVQPP